MSTDRRTEHSARLPLSSTGQVHLMVENLLEVPVHWIARRGLVPRKDGLHKALGKQLLTQMRGTDPYEQAVAMAQQLAVQSGMVSSDLRISGSPSLAALVSLVREGLGVAIMHGMLVAPQLAPAQLQALFGPLRRFLFDAPEPGQGLALELAGGRLGISRFG